MSRLLQATWLFLKAHSLGIGVLGCLAPAGYFAVRAVIAAPPHTMAQVLQVAPPVALGLLEVVGLVILARYVRRTRAITESHEALTRAVLQMAETTRASIERSQSNFLEMRASELAQQGRITETLDVIAKSVEQALNSQQAIQQRMLGEIGTISGNITSSVGTTLKTFQSTQSQIIDRIDIIAATAGETKATAEKTHERLVANIGAIAKTMEATVTSLHSTQESITHEMIAASTKTSHNKTITPDEAARRFRKLTGLVTEQWDRWRQRGESDTTIALNLSSGKLQPWFDEINAVTPHLPLAPVIIERIGTVTQRLEIPADERAAKKKRLSSDVAGELINELATIAATLPSDQEGFLL